MPLYVSNETAAKVDSDSKYESKVEVRFDDPRQPNIDRSTIAIITCGIISQGGDHGTIYYQWSSDREAWTTIAQLSSYVGYEGAGRLMAPATILIPPAHYYRVVTETHAGSPVFTIVSSFEFTL